MALVTKQDSNLTNLTYAVETSPGVLPGSPVWTQLEPNSYKSYGGEVKTQARMPINASRQLKKAVVVDLDATAGFTQDLTQTNFQDLSQCFFFAAMRTKSELAVATVGGSHQYEPASGGDTYAAGDLLFAKNFAAAANNGLKTVSGTPTGSAVTVTDTGVVSETGQAGTISRVGYAFGAGALSINVSGAYPVINSTAAFASDVLTTTGTFSDGDTVTIEGLAYTIQATLTNGARHVHKGTSTALTLQNLANAINFVGGGTPGTDYDNTATTANPFVTAVSDTTTLTVTAIVAGVAGNALTATNVSSGTDASWATSALTGGIGRDFTSLGLIPGEFIFVGGDSVKFFEAANNGFARVQTITFNQLILDKTQNVMVADDGTSTGSGGSPLAIPLYFGRVIKNESDPTLIVERTLQFERSMSFVDSSQPTQIQAEYIHSALANTMALDMKTAKIITMDLDFLGTTTELVPSSTGLKSGTRPALVSTDAFNSTSDVAFTKMAIVTSGNAAPTPLFAFFTDLTLNLKNNIKQNKAVSVLGAFSSTAGFFQVSAAVTAYFQSVAEMQAVINNDSITLESHLVKFNQGVSLDLPLVVMSKALADVKINEPITIPLSSDAAEGSLVNPQYTHTMLMVFWDYLPNLAG